MNRMKLLSVLPILMLALASKTPPPQITTQPQSVTVTAPAPATFNVVASGSKLSYQWLGNGGNITGATAASYTIPATTLAMNGSTFQVKVSNATATVTSGTATLTIVAAPTTLTMLSTFTLPQGTVGTAYSANVATLAQVTLNGTLGCSTCSYTVSPALPAGLTLAPTTGIISGTPTATASAVSLTFTVTDTATGLKAKSKVQPRAH
jgi:hypothetical protein